MSNDHRCKCHERMGNDFWFLPISQCLYGKCDNPPRKPCVGELIELATTPGLGLTLDGIDPIRRGIIQ